MIQEDYCNFDIAKLLKEKGFPQNYNVYYGFVYNEKDYEDEYEVQRMVLETRLVKTGTLSSYPIGVPEPKCYAPTLQMAMKWLREVHNYHIEIERNFEYFHNGIMHKPSYDAVIQDTTNKDKNYFVAECNIYEEACEAAIKYCLENLI